MEATKRIREGGFKNLIAGVTGNIMDDGIADYLRAGADIVFGKPLKMNMLTLLLRHVREEGSLSHSGMTLVEVRTKLEWVAKA